MLYNLSYAKHRLFRKLTLEISDERALRAMAEVPREAFVPQEYRHQAYDDVPLPIGEGQTISQPFMVAVMTSLLELQGGERVLEVGTGSGYQAAVLSRLVPKGRVITVERVPALVEAGRAALRKMDCHNVEVVAAGPSLGCSEKGPYDAIIVTAASPKLPQVLVEQLSVRGRMVIPIGDRESQELVKVLRTGEGLSVSYVGLCRFVPLIGPDAWPDYRG